MWIVTCACTQVLGGCSSSLSISCPSLVSTLIAAAHARLWSLFRRCSEYPLLVHSETKKSEKVSCLFSSSRLFPRLPPGQLWCTSPLQAVFTQPTPVFSLGSDLRNGASATSPHPPWWVSREASQASKCWLAPILCVSIFPLCPLQPCYCALLRGSKAYPHQMQHPVSTSEGDSLCVETFPPSQLPPTGADPVPILLSLFFSFFFCPTQVREEFLAFCGV